MKKLLSLVLVAVMVLSSVVTSFAITDDAAAAIPTRPTITHEDREAYNNNPEDYVIDVWFSDATIAEGETTAQISMNLKNNFGFWATRVFFVYPPCITVTKITSLYNRKDAYDPAYSLYTRNDADSNMELGPDNYKTLIDITNLEQPDLTYDIPGHKGVAFKDLFDVYGYKFGLLLPICENNYYTAEDDENDENYYDFTNFKAVDGPMFTIDLAYDESLNTTGETEIPIFAIMSQIDNLFSYGDSGVDDGEFTTIGYDGLITVPAQETGCEHTNTHESVKLAATCTAAGSKDIICDDCGETVETVTIDALGHAEVAIPAVDATCTTAGSTAGVKCSVCGDILTAPTTVDALGHTAKKAAGKDRYYLVTTPTTTTTGLMAKKCTECNEYFDDVVLAAVDEYKVHFDYESLVIKMGETKKVGFYLDVPATGTFAFVANPYWSDDLTVAVNQGTTAWTNEEWSWTLASTEAQLADIIEKNEVSGIEIDYTGLTTGTLYVASDEITDIQFNDGYVAYFDITAPMTVGTYDFGVVLNDDYGTAPEGTTAVYSYEVPPVVTMDVVVAECDHANTHDVEILAPTCSATGSADIICDDCGETVDTKTLDKIAHAEATIPAVDATCTTAGSTAGVKCSVCGDILTAPTTIDALGHTEVAIPAVDATCTTAGSTAGVKCSVCGDILTAPTTIDALGHTAKTTNGNVRHYIVTVPTTETAGLVAKKCTVCGEYFDEAELPAVEEYKVTIDNATVAAGETTTVGIYLDVPATGTFAFAASPYWSEDLVVSAREGSIAWNDLDWTWSGSPVAWKTITAKNAAAGITFDYTGLDAGVLYVAGEDITTVQYGDGYVAYFDITVPATASGEYRFGVVLNDTYATAAPNTTAVYTYETAQYVEATITVTACEHTNTHQETVTASTCTVAGSANVICDDCGEIVDTVELELANHAPVTVEGYAATCTEDGLTDGTKCENCGLIIDAQQTIPASGHDYGDWTIVRAATISAAGWREKTCSECQDVVGEEIPQLTDMRLNLRPEWGYYANAAECSVDNDARVINVVSKKNAPTVDFRLLNSIETFTFSVDSEDITVKLANGTKLDAGDTSKVVKYFEADVVNGYNQSYVLHVDYKGFECDYTVNVQFVYGPACEGVEPGYFAASAGFAEDDDHVINVVSKPGASEVDFRLLNMAKGSYPTLGGASAACVFQRDTTTQEYVNVTENGGETQTQWKYFRTYRKNGTSQTFDINVHLVDGTLENYTVHVEFAD